MNNIFYMASKTKYKITGLNLENFLFNLTSSGLSVTNIKRKKQSLEFVSSTINHQTIASFAANLGLSLKIIGQTGLIKFIKSLPYYIGTILGIIYSIFCVTHFTNFINKIDYIVQENHKCTNHEQCIFKPDNLNQIKTYISQYISQGKKISVDTKQLQNQIIANYSLIENCTIIRKGTTVKIELTEAVGKNVGLNKQIIAPNNCIIASITTFSGKALVKAGDVVTKGQVLVDSIGEILPRADIIAKVWYTGIAVHNINQTILKETGNTFTTTSLQLGSKTLIKAKACSYQYFSASQNTKYITNMLIPLKKVTHTYTELKLVQEYIPFENVKDTILAKSKQDATAKTSGTPIECTYSIVSQANTVRVDCFLLVEEQLGTISKDAQF